jgi:uncharacterized protein (TIGR00297 family)
VVAGDVVVEEKGWGKVEGTAVASDGWKACVRVDYRPQSRYCPYCDGQLHSAILIPSLVRANADNAQQSDLVQCPKTNSHTPTNYVNRLGPPFSTRKVASYSKRREPANPNPCTHLPAQAPYLSTSPHLTSPHLTSPHPPVKMRHEVAVPATLAIVYRAYSHKSLTPVGLIVAVLTATVHALHPWSAPFALLGIFFLLGSQATKVKADIKSSLTLSSSGSSGGEGPRTHIQVLANSLCASVLILLHVYTLSNSPATASKCLAHGGSSLLLTAGIVSNYAAVAADTFSSELGILSKSPPRLITTLRTVPPGTNGGVTLAGLLAGAAGSFCIALTSVLLLPFCPISSGPVGRVLMEGESRGWGIDDKVFWVLGITIWGLLGSVLDSVLGAVLQATVIDSRSLKVIEGHGGTKVLTHSGTTYGVKIEADADLRHRKGTGKKDTSSDPKASKHQDSRRILSGADLLDNNQINLLMAAIMSVGGIAVASVFYDVPLSSILS